jgi:diguanylate cyclase (GGDEF)-like protein
MSAQVALRRQVTHLTFHDGLTGLPNRAYVEQRAQDLLSQARQPTAEVGGDRSVAAVILLDMDGFTAIDEECGHAAGDLLLAQVARRLRLAVSPEDTVARWGGDEFAVLTESAASAEELTDIAERLSRSVAAQPFRIGDTDLAITASVGVALADGSPPAHVWRNAEIALARAKGFGAGRVEMFEPGQAGPGADEASGGTGDSGTGTGTPGAGGTGGSVAEVSQGGGATVAGPRGAGDAAIGPEPGPVPSAVGEAAETPAGAGA